MKSNSPDVTRRNFLQLSASALALSSSGNSFSKTIEQNRVIEYGDPLTECRYDAVQLELGPNRAQVEQTHTILMGMDEDSLLRPYRLRTGLPAPGFELGGWYSSNGDVPGHAFGQWISALSRYYAITGDEQTKQKIYRLVRGFSETVESTGRFYKEYPPDPGTTRSNAGYPFNMLVGGLIDAHEFAECPGALDALARATDAAVPHFGSSTDPQGAWVGSHNLLVAWQRSGRVEYLRLAKRYLPEEFLNSLARGENVLPGRHAYGHVSAMASAAKAYLLLGDNRYLQAAVNGFSFVEEQSFATGACGPRETFVPMPAADWVDPATSKILLPNPAIASLGDSLVQTQSHFETGCGSYAHFQLTRYLLRLTKDAKYGDSMERVMYNASLGMLPLNKFGYAFYYSNYHSHARKEYFDGFGHLMTDQWPCCSGTLTQLAADYHINAYYLDRVGAFVNLYVPSTVKWVQDGAQISLRQSGQYPLDDEVTFEITTSRPVLSEIRLRIPAWARNPSIRVNGEKAPEAALSGTFATLRREWYSGDRIELELPRRLELRPIDRQHPDTVALLCGPLVLFAMGHDTPKVTRAQLLGAKQHERGSVEWRADSRDGPIRLLTFWAIKDETYFTYFSV